MKTAPYTIFGKTKNVPVKVIQNNETIDTDEWDEELWVERPEDWYALGSPQLKNKRVRVIERSVWLRCSIIEKIKDVVEPKPKPKETIIRREAEKYTNFIYDHSYVDESYRSEIRQVTKAFEAGFKSAMKFYDDNPKIKR